MSQEAISQQHVVSRDASAAGRENLGSKVLRMARWFGRTGGKIVLALIVVLIVARIALPYVAKYFINKQLASLDGYWGHVEDVDISLWRGAYQIQDIKIIKTSAIGAPLFTAVELEFSVEWRALLDGEIVAEGDLRTPQVNFVNGPTEATTQSGEDQDWAQTLRDLVPLKINRFAALDGSVHYRDFHSSPRIDVFVQNIFFEVRDIQNTDESDETLPTSFYLRALAMHSGQIESRARADLLSPKPKFDLTFSLRRLRLAQVNPFLRAYGGIDAEAGRISAYSVLRSDGRRLRGYVNPLLEHVELNGSEEDGGFLDRVGDALAGAVVDILKNHNYDRFATRIPIEGDLENPQTDVWAMIGGVLRNGFIRAFQHGIAPN
ncbi:MAG: DUF748 domain-containing protein [Sandaracinaceae bacterium]|nr:DUF748 domain-containing protein [Sandaracinaceae bacterium]